MTSDEGVTLTDAEVKAMLKHPGASYAGPKFGWDDLTKAQIEWCESTIAARLAAVEALRKPEDVECPMPPDCERHGGFGSRGCTCGQEYRNEQAFTYNEALDDVLDALSATAPGAGQREVQERIEALAEVNQRIGAAADTVDGLAVAADFNDSRVRLRGKADGLRLAESYIDDDLRRLRADRSPEQT